MFSKREILQVLKELAEDSDWSDLKDLRIDNEYSNSRIVEKIGPIHVSHTDPGIDVSTVNGGTHLYTPSTGDLIVGAWIFEETQFNGGGLIIASEPPAGFDYWNLSYAGESSNTINAGNHWKSPASNFLFAPFTVMCLDETPIVAGCYGSPTQGEGDVIILIVPT